jgi:hypothetical protein
MNNEKARRARVFGWVCLGFSTVLYAVFILKSAAGHDVSSALLAPAMLLIIIGIIGLARAKKLEQK